MEKAKYINFVVVIILLLFTIAGVELFTDVDTPPEAGIALDRIPEKVGDWMGKDIEVSEKEKESLPDDTGFARKIFTNKEGRYLFFSIVLSGEDRRSIHRPEVCLPGQGWGIVDREIVPIKIEGSNPYTLEVMKLLITKQGVKSFNIYWFVGKNRLTASHLMRVFYMTWDRIFKNVNHRWAYVTIFSSVVVSEEETLEMLKDFIRQTFPLLSD